MPVSFESIGRASLLDETQQAAISKAIDASLPFGYWKIEMSGALPEDFARSLVQELGGRAPFAIWHLGKTIKERMGEDRSAEFRSKVSKLLPVGYWHIAIAEVACVRA